MDQDDHAKNQRFVGDFIGTVGKTQLQAKETSTSSSNLSRYGLHHWLDGWRQGPYPGLFTKIALPFFNLNSFIFLITFTLQEIHLTSKVYRIKVYRICLGRNPTCSLAFNTWNSCYRENVMLFREAIISLIFIIRFCSCFSNICCKKIKTDSLTTHTLIDWFAIRGLRQSFIGRWRFAAKTRLGGIRHRSTSWTRHHVQTRRRWLPEQICWRWNWW